jgi:hypothetical protein
LSETFKYVVQVDCEPSPAPHAAEIVDSLQDRFNISQHSCSGATLTVELAYGHPLANGVFKDLADALIDALTDRKLELRSGVINRVQQNWLATLIGALNRKLSRGARLTGAAVLGMFIGLSLVKATGGSLGGSRLVPVMYFHQDVVLDLMLSAKARHIPGSRALESN